MAKTAWYVVYSKPQKEDVAQFYCRLKGVECFFPRLLLPASARRGKRVVPLFPNYFFVRIRFQAEYHHVIWSPGVKYLVSAKDVPLPVDDTVIKYLMRQANAEGIIKGRSNLKVGQEIRIAGGSLAGIVGMIHKVPNAKSRVQVLLKLLNREVKAEVPLHMVGSGWVASAAVVAAEGFNRHRVESSVI
jgi:transcription antitermination factor NusG